MLHDTGEVVAPVRHFGVGLAFLLPKDVDAVLLLVGKLFVDGFLPCDVIFTDVPSGQIGLMNLLQ